MANEKNVGLVVEETSYGKGIVIPVTFTRNFSDYTDEKTGKNYKSVKVRVNFELEGESFRLALNDNDIRLIAYILRSKGVPIMDLDNVSILSEEKAKKIIENAKRIEDEKKRIEDEKKRLALKEVQ